MTVATGETGPGVQTTTGSAGQGQEPPANGTGTQEGQGQQGTGEFDPSTIQDPALKAYLDKVQKDAHEARQEAARYRTERNEFQRQNETEQERLAREQEERGQRVQTLEQENETLRRQIRDQAVNGAALTAATQAKAHNPATVAQMIGPRVELGDDGKPKNLQDLLTELRQSDPYLFRRTEANAGDGTREPSTPTTMNDQIRAQVAARRGRA